MLLLPDVDVLVNKYRESISITQWTMPFSRTLLENITYELGLATYFNGSAIVSRTCGDSQWQATAGQSSQVP